MIPATLTLDKVMIRDKKSGKFVKKNKAPRDYSYAFPVMIILLLIGVFVTSAQSIRLNKVTAQYEELEKRHQGLIQSANRIYNEMRGMQEN